MVEQLKAKQDLYSPTNERFRKAYIRERLADIKAEREALVAERNELVGSQQRPPRRLTPLETSQ